jgi:divalent metal cation (Fe/Co/Zn/Cd) transporter
MSTISLSAEQEKKYYSLALGLAIITIVYNLIEGIIATWFGFEDETLALFGFGVDSFIEMISGIGILHMILRIRNNPNVTRDGFERTALRITGTAFYLLTAGLIITSVINIITGHAPESTFWGVIISSISILVMWALILGKLRAGKALKSDPIIADANCTKVCMYMSVILLASSGIYELTGFTYADAIGTLGLAWFSFKEGRECFEKVRNNQLCGCEHN